MILDDSPIVSYTGRLMSCATLVDFLRERQNSDFSSTLRDEWTVALDELFVLMRGWLEPVRDEGLLDVEIVRVSVAEPACGSYEAPSLRIKTWWQEIDVTPISRVVFGGSGRVDVGLGHRKMTVVRTPDKSRWLISGGCWGDVEQSLTEESFTLSLQHLLELSGI